VAEVEKGNVEEEEDEELDDGVCGTDRAKRGLKWLGMVKKRRVTKGRKI
jgi:hypothetical protein